MPSKKEKHGFFCTAGCGGLGCRLRVCGDSETIVAVNTAPHAPIFSVSRYAVVGDCVEILKEWIRMLKEKAQTDG